MDSRRSWPQTQRWGLLHHVDCVTQATLREEGSQVTFLGLVDRVTESTGWSTAFCLGHAALRQLLFLVAKGRQP